MAFGLAEDWHTKFPRDRLIEGRERLTVAGLRPGQPPIVAGQTLQITHDCQGRSWWQCPKCSRRCKYLYAPELWCHKCLNLDWSCRHIGRQLPGLWLIRRWRRQLGITEELFTPIPRIKRARWRQHELMRRIWSAETRLIDHLAKVNDDLERRVQRSTAADRKGRRRNLQQNQAGPAD